MNKKTQQQWFAFGALVLFTLASPGASALIPGNSSLHGSLSVIHQRAEDLRKDVRMERREYAQIREKCVNRLAAGEDVECPGINDARGIRLFLRGVKPVRKDAVAPHESDETDMDTEVTEEVVLEMDDLTADDQLLLRRFHRIGVCPESLMEYTPGFYALCQSLLKTVTPSERKRKAFQRKVERQVENRMH